MKWPTLFTKTAAGNLNFWEVWTEGADVCTRWGKVGTERPLTDRYTAEAKNVGRKNETSPAEQAESEAQSKFDKQKRLKYVDTLEEAQSNLNIKPMRAYVLDAKREKKLTFPVSVQPKFNGLRCMSYNVPEYVRLMSRGGKDYSVEHIQKELEGRLPDAWSLDGELYAHGVSLQNIRSYIATPQPKTLMVMYYCYDCTTIPANKDTWGARFAHLNEWFWKNKGLEYVELSPSRVANSMEGIRELHAMWVAAGFEGVIVRTMQGTYRMGAKSTHLLKLKDHEDAEFRVIGWTVGKDGVVLYRCIQEQGLEFEVRPMGTEEERAELLRTADADVGKLLTVRYQERSDDNIPIHGRGVAFRPPEDMD